MPLTNIQLDNFTVFKKLDVNFCNGINIFIGENGTGKTHLMKILYSAAQASRHDVSFANKLVRVFRPDGLNIRRLVKRAVGVQKAKIKVCSDSTNLSATFSTRTNKWNADSTGELNWERNLADLTSTFIPAKEILSNAWNLEAAVDRNNVDFDDTYVDIVTAAKIDISAGRDITSRTKYLEMLQRITSGTVQIQDERFYLKPGNQTKIEFQLVAEGIRKIALLWQLIKNGTLEKGAVLFWDEPEANINPIHIPVIVEMLLELQRAGVQIFVSTHDYILAKYFEIKKEENADLTFYSFFHTDGGVACEWNNDFKGLSKNPIIEAFNTLLDEVYDKAVEG